MRTPESPPISPSVVIPMVAKRGTLSRGSSNSNMWRFASPPSNLYYGPSSSVSSLAFDSGAAGFDDDLTQSSSEDEEFLGYDLDDRASLCSRRPSAVSVGGALGSFTSNSSPSSVSLDEGPNLTGLGIRERNTRDINTRDIKDVATISGNNERRAIVRQTFTTGRSLRPKIKSLLRITKELQEELNPLDFEIKREAEVTSNFRQDNGDQDSLLLKYKQQQTTNVFSFSDTDDSDLNLPGSPPRSQSTQKRKKMEDNSDSPGALKRRAVSPGPSSPAVGSPTAMNKRASRKQVQDASDGFQNMSLA